MVIEGKLTTEEEYVECLVRLQHHQVRAKNHSSRLLLVVVDLDCTVARATVGHNPGLVSLLETMTANKKKKSTHLHILMSRDATLYVL